MALMRTINRRTFNQQLASVLDSVLETGQPVRVEGRDGRAVVVGPAPQESAWVRWQRTGAIRKGRQSSTKEFAAIPRIKGVDADWLIAEMAQEW
jgi:hypothetical protein